MINDGKREHGTKEALLLGIDAVIIDENNKSLTVMQFKFPGKNTTINCEIEQGDILKTINGFKTIIKNDRDYTGNNTKFKDFKILLQNMFIDNFKIYFVSYNKGVIANRYIVENYVDEFFWPALNQAVFY